MVAARLQEQHGMFRLFGCLVVQLFGCSAVQLLGRSAESVGRPRDGSTSPEMPVAFRRFCPESGSDSLFGPAFRTSFPGLLRDLLRDWLSDLLFGSASGSASRSAFGLVSGPAFRTCFRVCFPDAGAILFDCGMRSVVPIRPQDSSAQFLPQQLPAAGV
jgi:hypothetical protein